MTDTREGRCLAAAFAWRKPGCSIQVGEEK